MNVSDSVSTADSTPPRSDRRRLALIGLPFVAALAAVLAFAAPASAASPCAPTSCVHNNNASTVGMTCVSGSGCSAGTAAFVSNNVQVTMTCWFDSVSATGNYSSPRWFHITVPGLLAGQWVVHSSYVYNQTTVGHC